jgi:hypothetical protein
MSCVAVGNVDDLEEEEAIVFDAAIKASVRDTVNGGASTRTRAGSTGRTHTVLAPVIAVHRLVMEQGFAGGSDRVLDNDPEGEVLMLTDSKDDPIMQRRTDQGKTRRRDEEYDVDDIHRGCFSETGEDHDLSLIEKQETVALKYQLGRHLTHIASFHVTRSVCR